MAKIVIVDDDAVVRSVIESFLSRKGHDIVLCKNPSEAKNEVQDGGYDVVMLLDIIFSGHENGFDMLKWMKKKCPETPVVMMTASGFSTAALEGCIKMGAKDYVIKTGDFTHEIENALSNLNVKMK